MRKKPIVIKIGGSLLYKRDMELNLYVLKKLQKWYTEAVEMYDPLVIVVGGGKLSRTVTDRVKKYIKKDVNRHSIAMELTQTNAYVLKGYLNDDKIFCPESLGDAYEYLMSDGPKIMISGGLKTGWSTDMDAAVFADIVGLKKVYKMSDIDYLYTEDPKGNPNAKPIKDITWKKYRQMFGIDSDDTHKPNMHIPISAECTRFCQEKEISFFISGGETIYGDKSFEETFEFGTHIHP